MKAREAAKTRVCTRLHPSAAHRPPAPSRHFPDGRPRRARGGCGAGVVFDGEKSLYLMTYTCFDGRTARLCTASSPTLEADTWEKHGLAFPDFPEVWSKSGSIVARVPSAPRPARPARSAPPPRPLRLTPRESVAVPARLAAGGRAVRPAQARVPWHGSARLGAVRRTDGRAARRHGSRVGPKSLYYMFWGEGHIKIATSHVRPAPPRARARPAAGGARA